MFILMMKAINERPFFSSVVKVSYNHREMKGNKSIFNDLTVLLWLLTRVSGRESNDPFDDS